MPDSFLRAYVDDSGEKEYGPQTSRYFVYAAVIVALEDEAALNAQLADIKQRCFGTPDDELKSNWLRIPRERQRRYIDRFGTTSERLDMCVEELYEWFEKSSVSLAAAVSPRRK